MATPSKMLEMLNVDVIRELIDLRKNGPFKGLEWFDGARVRRENQFQVEYEFMTGTVRTAPLSNPKSPTAPVPLQDFKRFGVTPASIRIHHCVYDQDKIDLRKPGTTERMGDGLNEMVANILADKIIATKEMLLWQALGGTISYNGAQTKLIFEIDYDLPVTHNITLTGTDVWTNVANSDPLKNINDWLQVYEDDAGFLPNTICMNRKTLNYLLATTKFGNLFNSKEILPMEGINSFIASTSGEETMLKVYKGIYQTETGVDAAMVADGYVYMFHTENSISYEEVSAAENEPSPGNYAAGPWTELDPLTDPKGVKIMAGENMLPVVVDPNRIFKALVI